ncbi:hypothetical protein MGYG_05473 [Nannizzia gypsea CBS 118893]|uniref:BTB domain-containing protein n=1 Tax=Arthroderma gypseum (strain ATCC MYA-4604 / CBS 118893) TaxID=535722 RepID=E4UW32_ARTGP|nr:hypothetical protein MGYG_05473 [Nannizzia gypsea CBS 118893]EFR02480.1 hypothetical protein MGYG_05473 [Nannizzia gypsea CBS 118893]
MAQPKADTKEESAASDTWVDVKAEAGPEVEMIKSPYATKAAMFRTLDGTIFSVPEGFVSKLPTLVRLREKAQDGVTNVSFDNEVAHVFFHHLCTGQFQLPFSEPNWGWDHPKLSHTLWKLKYSLRVLAAAKKYGFFTLECSAKTSMEEDYKDLPLTVLIDHIQENLSCFKDEMIWLGEQMETALETALSHNPSIFKDNTLLEKIGHSPEFDRLLVQVIGEMYKLLHVKDSEEDPVAPNPYFAWSCEPCDF